MSVQPITDTLLTVLPLVHSLRILFFQMEYILLGTTVLSSSCSEYRGTSRQLQNVCGEILSMLTGSKPPNSTGKDVFLFYYTKIRIYANGNRQR